MDWFNLLDLLVLEAIAFAAFVTLWVCVALIEWIYANVVQGVSVLVHEIGHGLAAVAAGRSVTVVVGREPALVTFRLGRMALKLHPRLGQAYCDYGESGVSGRAAAVVTVAGPLASLLQATAAVALAYQLRHSAPVLAIISLVFAVGGAVGVAQLIPFGDDEDGQKTRAFRDAGLSDGGQLLAMWRASRNRPGPMTSGAARLAFWRRRAHPRTAAEAHDLLQRRLGPPPGAAENRKPTPAEMRAFEDRLAREIGRPEYALLRMHIDRVLAALPPEDHPGWQDPGFRPDLAIDWDEVLGDMPGYRPRRQQ